MKNVNVKLIFHTFKIKYKKSSAEIGLVQLNNNIKCRYVIFY